MYYWCTGNIELKVKDGLRVNIIGCILLLLSSSTSSFRFYVTFSMLNTGWTVCWISAWVLAGSWFEILLVPKYSTVPNALSGVPLLVCPVKHRQLHKGNAIHKQLNKARNVSLLPMALIDIYFSRFLRHA